MIQQNSFKIYYDDNGNWKFYAYMKNICYDFENNTILIYNSTDPNLSKLVAQKCINYIDKSLLFSYFLLDWNKV